MSLVRIPPVYDGAGVQVDATVDVRLITADGKPCIAFNATELATEYQAVALPAAEPDGLTIALAPTAALALPSGSATWYQITLRTRHRAEIYLVQVADSPAVQELSDLAAAAAIDPADIAAGRLLPDPTDVPDDWTLSVDGGVPVWVSVPPVSGVPEAPLTGGPYGRQAAAWIEAVGPEGPAGPQ